MDEELMLSRIKDLCHVTGMAIDRISIECDINQNLVAKMYMETMKIILDKMKEH